MVPRAVIRGCLAASSSQRFVSVSSQHSKDVAIEERRGRNGKVAGGAAYKRNHYKGHRENNEALEETFAPDPDHFSLFRKMDLVHTGELRKFMHDAFKLRFVQEREKNTTYNNVELELGTSAPRSYGVELMRNVASKHDYWIVRRNAPHMLYYRMELMLQRLEYLKTVGLNERQRLRNIQKVPPVLMMTMTNRTFHGKLLYLRGLVPYTEESNKFPLHVYYPISKQLRADRQFIENRVKMIGTQLNIKQPAVLQELLNIPCFFMDPATLESVGHVFVHLRYMPKFFNMDQHTLNVLPPMCNITSLNLSPEKHFRWSTPTADLEALPTYQPEQIFDISYPSHNGKATPECLTTFLLRADGEEKKHRETSFKKQRGGFNVKPRQG